MYLLIDWGTVITTSSLSVFVFHDDSTSQHDYHSQNLAVFDFDAPWRDQSDRSGTSTTKTVAHSTYVAASGIISLFRLYSY